MAYSFVASRVFVHRWPRDSPEWTAGFRDAVDNMINTRSGPRTVVLTKHGSVSIAGYEFGSPKNVGISVPFFKDECRMIFEAGCRHDDDDGGDVMRAHAHVYAADDHLQTFGMMAEWKAAHGL